MDGTLTDTERLWTISLERVARSYGRRLSRAARESMVGQDMWATIDLLHRDLGITAAPQATAQRLTDETMQVFREGLPVKDGAVELLAAVRSAGLRTALVTATYRELVDVALDTIGRDAFDVTVCGDEVSANKPDPAPYLRALQLLDLPPADCLVIEDSPTGSRSAVAAGLGVLVVPSEIPVQPGPGMLFASTLAGVDVEQLREMHQRLREARG